MTTTGPKIYSDPFYKIGPGPTLAVFLALLVVLIALLCCIGYCCCFSCLD